MQNENGQGQRVVIIRPVMNSAAGETRVFRSREAALKEFGGDSRSWIPQEKAGYWECAKAPHWDRDSKEYWAMEEVILRGPRDANAPKITSSETFKGTAGQQTPKASQTGKAPVPGKSGA